MSHRANSTNLNTVYRFSLEIFTTQPSEYIFRKVPKQRYSLSHYYSHPGITRAASSPYLVLQAALLSKLKPKGILLWFYVSLKWSPSCLQLCLFESLTRHD